MFLLYALLMGIFITFLYDLLRIFRRVWPHRDFFVSLEDICFWIYCAGEVFLLLHHESNGTLRWFAVLGSMTGMLLYKKLVSPFFVKYVSLWLRIFLGYAGRGLRLLFSPVTWLLKLAGAHLKQAGRGAKRTGRTAGRLFKKKLTFLLKLFKMTI